MATMPSIPSLPPAGFPTEETPPITARGGRPGLAGAALLLSASVFLLPRWRRGPAVEPVHALVSPTPTVTAPPPAPAVQPEPERAVRIDLTRPTAPAAGSASSSAPKKGAKAKPAPEPIVESPPAAAPPILADPTPAASVAAVDTPPPAVEPPPPPAPVEPIAVTPPPPPPAPPPPAPAVVPPPLNPALARVEIGPATQTTGTTASNVNKTIAPLGSKITACYRSALAHHSTANDEAGVLHVETNEDGVITEARLDGPLAAGAGRCIVGAVRGRRISNVDTGSASADVPLSFKVR
jgi:hypothetical protein